MAIAKKKVGYDNPKCGRGIIFDETTLTKLSALFPEENIKTDADVMELAEKQGEKLVQEVETRLRVKRTGMGVGTTATETASPQRLPTFTYKGEVFTVDFRLREIRHLVLVNARVVLECRGVAHPSQSLQSQFFIRCAHTERGQYQFGSPLDRKGEVMDRQEGVQGGLPALLPHSGRRAPIPPRPHRWNASRWSGGQLWRATDIGGLRLYELAKQLS